MDNAVTPRQFAEWCVAALFSHENSYDRNTQIYSLSWSEAVEWAVIPEVWKPVITCLLVSGYSDLWDWTESVGVKWER